MVKCKKCNGTGKIPDDYDECGGVAGAFVELMHMRGELMKTCPMCKGTGKKKIGD